jgi:prophage regulatory protein
MPAVQSPRLLHLRDVLDWTALGRSTLYRLVAAGSFPKPIRIHTTSIAAWSSVDVDDWVRGQLNIKE